MRVTFSQIHSPLHLGVATRYLQPYYMYYHNRYYYFWPREDAWEQMSQMMASKLWIPELDKVEVLNR